MTAAQRIVITGGAGFIGATLCHRLSRTSWVRSTVVLDDLSTGSAEALPAGVELVRASVLDEAAVQRALAGADAVVHLAARSSVTQSLERPVDTGRVNGLGSALVFDAARRSGVRLAVLASSAAVYGDHYRRPVRESDPARPTSVYGASKLAAEGYALAFAATYGLPTLALRLFNVYGPGQRGDAVIPAFLSRALRDEPVPVHGDGSQLRDFVHVEDVCELVADALRRELAHPEPVNVATGTSTSVAELLALLENVLGRPVRHSQRPPRPADVHHSQADVALLHELFPRFTPKPLRAGLADTARCTPATVR